MFVRDRDCSRMIVKIDNVREKKCGEKNWFKLYGDKYARRGKNCSIVPEDRLAILRKHGDFTGKYFILGGRLIFFWEARGLFCKKMGRGDFSTKCFIPEGRLISFGKNGRTLLQKRYIYMSVEIKRLEHETCLVGRYTSTREREIRTDD